jgi:hypothetical protein
VLADPVEAVPGYAPDLPLLGVLVLALGRAEIARWRRTADPAQAARGARLVALAERLHHVRTFQPTMSSARSRAAAQQADAAAHAAAAAAVAHLDGDGLRDAAREALSALPPPSAPG